MKSNNMADYAKDPDTDTEGEEMEILAEDEPPMNSATILKYHQMFQELLIKEGSAEVQKNQVLDCKAAAQERQKHIASGWAIYERVTAGLQDTNTKAHELIVQLNKILKQDSFSSFVVQEIDINLEGQGKCTRLNAGTNHKRVRSVSLRYINVHNHLLDVPTSKEHDNSRTFRSRSEEIVTEACERGRSLQRAGVTEPWIEVGYASDVMSERSSGTTRRTRSSLISTIEGSVDLPSGPDTSGTFEEEAPKSAGADEAVYIHGSSKRIRQEDVPKVSEKEEDKLGLSTSQEIELDAFPTEVRDERSWIASKAEPKPRKSRWAFGERYKDPNLNCLPDYGPSARLPATPQEAEAIMPRYIHSGGPKPINRLVNHAALPQTKQPRPVSQKAKAFDLTGDAKSSRLEYGYPAKRQRLDNGSSNRPIDVDNTSPQNTRQSVPSSTWSGHSRSRDGQEANTYHGAYESVREHRKVEETVRPPKKQRKRNGSATDKRLALINGHQRFDPESFDQIAKEDQNDLISDDDAGEDWKIVGPKQPIKSNTRLEIQIQGSEGSSHGRPRGQKGYATSTNPKSSSLETAQASRFFRKEDPSLLSQDDQDELSTDQYGNAEHVNIAQRLLRKGQPAKSGDRESHGIAINVGDSSEDEISTKKNDITPGKYGPSRTKSKKPEAEDSYIIHQVFSEVKKWLLQGQLERWILVHDKSAGLLTFYNRSDDQVLQFRTKDVEKIEIADRHNKMVFHKSRNHTAAFSTHIYVEFTSSDECEQLFENLKIKDMTIGRLSKDRDYLDKVFRNLAQKPIQAKRQTPIAQQEPDDIRLVKARAEKKLFGGKWVEGNKTSRNVKDGNQKSGPLERGTRSKGLAKDMRGRSPSHGLLEIEESRRDSNAKALQSGEFYGNSSNARANGADAHGTRSSGRLAKVDSTPAFRQSPRQRPRSPTPEPARWTANNPEWVKDVGWQSSLIYPPNGKDKATVDMQDVARLDEGEFLNDNLILFYLRWLEERLVKDNPEAASRIYFHNTFFYTRLTKHGKGKSGGINYEAVERWTAKIDLLQYDYIVVPVNETVHWYVAIICNAPKLLKQPLEETAQLDVENGVVQEDPNTVESGSNPTISPPKSPAKTIPDDVSMELKEMTLEDHSGVMSIVDGLQSLAAIPVASEVQKDIEPRDPDSQPLTVSSDIGGEKPVQAVQSKKSKRKSAPPPRKYDPKEPRIITLDSLGLSHSPTCANLKKYLMQEIKAKKNIEIEEPRNLGMTAKNIPQQDNHCDCGPFLLTYIEEFLKRPDGFVHDILQQNEQDFSRWRSASDMRRHIREQLFELQKEQVREAVALKKEKAKSKQAAKAGTPASGSTSKSASREASKSARNSASPEKAQPLPEVIDQVPAEKADLAANESTETPAKVTPEHELSKSTLVEPRFDHTRQNSVRGNVLLRTISRVTSALLTYSHVEEKEDLARESLELKTSSSQPIVIDDSQNFDDELKDATVAPKKVKDRRSSGGANARDSKSSTLHSPVGTPKLLRQASTDKIYVNRHPLPDSSQEEEPAQQQSPRTRGRVTKTSKHHETGKIKAGSRVESHQATEDDQQNQEWNGVGANLDESLGSVHLLDSPERHPYNEDSRQQKEDDEMFLKDAPSRAASPPDVSYLSSSSPTEVVHQSSLPGRSRSQGKETSVSPRSVKRPSSHVAENGSRSAKRMRKTDVVDLVGDHHPPEALHRDAADAAMLQAHAGRRRRLTE
ncbi:hypothetical protein ONS96_000807 [Cadophora gregata f. sp. sojae]|nr:hypothetical protein ONS96_000807 [Cadophora gregata f. sp. sojae]